MSITRILVIELQKQNKEFPRKIDKLLTNNF